MPALRADFPLSFLEAFADNAPPGTTGYRFVIGTAVARQGPTRYRAAFQTAAGHGRPSTACGRSPSVGRH